MNNVGNSFHKYFRNPTDIDEKLLSHLYTRGRQYLEVALEGRCNFLND